MPPESPPPAEPQDQPRETAADRLLRAQAAELEALRSRVQDLPDPDTLTEWRAKAQRFDELNAELPTWREQLQAAHQQEREQLQQQVSQHQAQVAAASLENELQREFLQAGGNPVHFSMWRELYGSKYAQRGEDGRIVCTENGQSMAIADVLNQQRRDPLFGVLFHPAYGTGSGARSGRDGRVVSTAGLQNMKTGDLFREAFSRKRA